MASSLLFLNDDCLRQIFSHLNPRDALNVALTASHLRVLAMSSVLAKISYERKEQLPRLHQYLTSVEPATNVVRAHYLRELKLGEHAFTRWTVLAQVIFFRAVDVSQAHLLADILGLASNLRSLHLVEFSPSIHQERRIMSSISSMTQLTSLTLHGVDNSDVVELTGLPACVQELHLSYRFILESRNPITFVPLLTMLIRAQVHVRKEEELKE